jgi:hypothetical protein
MSGRQGRHRERALANRYVLIGGLSRTGWLLSYAREDDEGAESRLVYFEKYERSWNRDARGQDPRDSKCSNW